MADLATLGLRVVNGQAVQAIKETDTALKNLGSTAATTNAAYDKTTRKIDESRVKFEAWKSQVGQTQPIAQHVTHVNSMGAAHDRAVFSANRLQGGLRSLATNIIGLNPQVSQLANVLGTFAVGSGMMVGILAGVAAIGYAYNKLTEDTRKLGEETDKAVLSLQKMHQLEVLGVGADLKIQRGTIVNQIDALLAKRQTAVTAAARQAGSPFGEAASRVAAIDAEIARLRGWVSLVTGYIEQAERQAVSDWADRYRSQLDKMTAAEKAAYDKREKQLRDHLGEMGRLFSNDFGAGASFSIDQGLTLNPIVITAADRRAAEEDARSREMTYLPANREAEFRAWIKKYGIADLDHPFSRYDYRGAFLAGVGSEISSVDNLPHWPDTFKQHGHPTFSVESKYSRGPYDGGRWEGETFIPPPTLTEGQRFQERQREQHSINLLTGAGLPIKKVGEEAKRTAEAMAIAGHAIGNVITAISSKIGGGSIAANFGAGLGHAGASLFPAHTFAGSAFGQAIIGPILGAFGSAVGAGVDAMFDFSGAAKQARIALENMSRAVESNIANFEARAYGTAGSLADQIRLAQEEAEQRRAEVEAKYRAGGAGQLFSGGANPQAIRDAELARIDAAEAALIARLREADAIKAVTEELNKMATAVRNAPSGFKVESYINRFAAGRPWDYPGGAINQPFSPKGGPTGTGAFNISMNGVTFEIKGNTGEALLKDVANSLRKVAATTIGGNAPVEQAWEYV